MSKENWIDVKDNLPKSAPPFFDGEWVVVKTQSNDWHKACLCEYFPGVVQWVMETGKQLQGVTHWQGVKI